MLEILTLIFLNISTPSLFFSDSLAKDSTLNMIKNIDTMSFKNDSIEIEKIKESQIKIISFKVNSNQIYKRIGRCGRACNKRRS